MLTVAAAILERGAEILVCRRRADGPHSLKWEFPGGKVEPGEEPAQALVRELREELGIEAIIGPKFAAYEFAYPNKTPILLVFFIVREWTGEIQNRVFEELQWSRREALGHFDFLEGDLTLIQLIREIHVD